MTRAGHQTSSGRTFDAQVLGLAERQHAVCAAWQLAAAGLSASTVRNRVQSGRLHRVHHGVYALVPLSLLTGRGQAMAAVLACGSGAALSHRSAADLEGLRATARALIEVIVAGRSTRRHRGIQVHRANRLRPDDITVVDGIPVTTVARTLLDLAAVVGERALERALDQAEMLQVFDLDALRDQIFNNPGTRGSARLRVVLNRHVAGTTVTWSELEEAFLAACRAADLPLPRVNAFIDPRDGEMPVRADFSWPEQRVVVETDSIGVHLTRGAFETDRLRDQRLTAAGWRVIRVTWRQVRDDPARVAAILATLLRGTGAGA